MVKIKFNAKRTKTGNSYCVLIPIGIARLLSEDKEYSFEITEKKVF